MRLLPGRVRTRLSFRLLALLLVLLSVVPLIVLSGFVLMRLVDEQMAGSERRLLEAARAQAAEVDRELTATIQTLQALAGSERLERGDLEGFHRDAVRVAATQDWWAVTAFDATGRPLMNTRVPWGEALIEAVDHASLTETLQTRAPVVGRLRTGPAGNLAFPVRVPVWRDGTVTHVLSAIVTSDALRHTVVRRLPEGEEWTRTVFDPSGAIVARTREPEIYIGRQVPESVLAQFEREGEALFRNAQALDGTQVVAAYARGSVFGWFSSVNMPESVFSGPLRATMLEFGLLSVIALLLSGGGVALIARRISDHLHETARAAALLARGEPAPTLRRSGIREFDEVADALQQSAALLAERERERDEHLVHAEEARAAAEAAERRKDEFLAMLGHELRNPLAPMMTALRLIEMREPVASREHRVLARQVQHLRTLVDDLLDVARITRGGLHLRMEIVDVREIIQRAAEMVGPALDERRHRLAVEVPSCHVHGDPARLAQIFANLIGNAAKYTPEGGSIQVEATRTNGRVDVAVRDNGQGIAPAMLPHVFDLFWQGARGADRREGGLGLGLAIVRHLAQLHGGSVAATSGGAGQGSVFTVSLPVAAAAGQEQAAEPRRALPRAETSRILVVDDNHDAAIMLADLLREAGHTVATAHDGAEALDAARTLRPQVAILDIGLPVMDGYELARHLAHTLAPEPPVLIAVTGYGQPHDVARSREHAFAAHLVKPVDPEQLAIVLAAHRPAPNLAT